MNALSRLASLLLITFASVAHAGDGVAIFVAGTVDVERDGRLQSLAVGEAVFASDRIVTHADGRAQIRMSDNALLSIRPNSSLRISAYAYTGEQAPESGARTFRTAIFELIQGGLRVISGRIAKEEPDDFRVETPVAHLSVRGTTFDVACIDSCSSGGVFGVSNGKILVRNKGGELVLNAGEFAFAASFTEAPQRRSHSPRALRDDVEGSSASDGDQDDDSAGSAPSDEGDTPGPEGQTTATPGNTSPQFNGDRDLAFAVAPAGDDPDGEAYAVPQRNEELGQTSDGDITAFSGNVPSNGQAAPAQFDIGSAQLADTGRDPDSDIRWGRWSGGTAQITRSDGSTENLDLSQTGLHWIVSPLRQDQVSIPQTGNRSFTLIGNTDPTDSAGNRGVLGQATLSADFLNQTVSSTLDIQIDTRNWSASGTGSIGNALSASTPDHIFGGAYDTVVIDGLSGGGGSFAGFFTPDAEAAGLSYTLNGPSGGPAAPISGVAAFDAP